MSDYYGVRRVGDHDEAYLEHFSMPGAMKQGHKYIARIPKAAGQGWRYIYTQAELAAAKAGKGLHQAKRTAESAATGLRRSSKVFRQVDNRLGITRSGAQVKKANANRRRVNGTQDSLEKLASGASRAAGTARRIAGNAAKAAGTAGKNISKTASDVARSAGTAAGNTVNSVSKTVKGIQRSQERKARNKKIAKRNAESKEKALANRKDYSNLRGFSPSTADAAKRSRKKLNDVERWSKRGSSVNVSEYKRYNQEDMREDKAQRRLTSGRISKRGMKAGNLPGARYFDKDEGYQTNNRTESLRLQDQVRRRKKVQTERTRNVRGAQGKPGGFEAFNKDKPITLKSKKAAEEQRQFRRLNAEVWRKRHARKS